MTSGGAVFLQQERLSGLPVICVDAIGGSGKIYLHGAHLAAWTPVGHRPVLWMSSTSRFSAGMPIRGGVPVCFPWFGKHPEHPSAPQHGFARLSEWELIGAREVGESVSVELRLTDTDESRASAWPHRFEAVYTITIGAELRFSLEVENRDDIGFRFEAALHNYYAVADTRLTRITGLENREFLVEGVCGFQLEAGPMSIGSGIGRRYPDARSATIEDIGNGRTITVVAGGPGRGVDAGSGGMIVWNPGAVFAAGMDDFADNEWTGMVCLETTNTGRAAIHLEPGERFRTSVTVSVVPVITDSTVAAGTVPETGSI